jgi:hypothetical protein
MEVQEDLGDLVVQEDLEDQEDWEDWEGWEEDLEVLGVEVGKLLLL